MDYPCDECKELVPVEEHHGNERSDGTSSYLCCECYEEPQQKAKAKDEEVFDKGIFLLIKKHGLTFTEAKDLALHYVDNRPGMISYMVKNWNQQTEICEVTNGR